VTTSWWDPDQPFADDYPDQRSWEQQAEDQRTVRRQVGNLGLRGQDESVRRELAEGLLRRRVARDEPMRYVPVMSSQRGFDMLVVGGELLIRRTALDDARVEAYLRTIPFDEREDIEGLDNRVVRLRNDTLSTQRLNDIARFLRRQGVQVSLNHVAPSGPIGKALAGPEPTESTLPFVDGPSGAEVAVVDTGIAPDLRTDGWLRAWAVPRDAQNEDQLYDPPVQDQVLTWAAGHGTSVAGVVQQIEPGVHIRMYRGLDVDGQNDEVQVSVAMVQAVVDGARVLNCSFGTETLDDQPPIAMQVALELIQEIAGDEAVLVAAAGNFGSSRPCWPAAFRSVLSVASLTWDGRPSEWSNRGFWIDCCTVGEGILTPYVVGRESSEVDFDPDQFDPPDPWALWSGTSFAAPQVTGAIARLRRQQPGMTPREAVRQLLSGGKLVPDYGRALKFLPGT
jgi:hypothetical protein